MMVEQSNRKLSGLMLGGEELGFNTIPPKPLDALGSHVCNLGCDIRCLQFGPQNQYTAAFGAPIALPTNAHQRSMDWERIQREKKEAKRKARWRVFWDCLLAAGCGMAWGGFFLLMLWVKDYFNI